MSGGLGFLNHQQYVGDREQEMMFFFPSKNAVDIFWILTWGRTVQVFPSPVYS